MDTPAILLVVGGLVTLVGAVPLALNKVPPNRWYGFRTTTTLSDARIWYRVNAGTGRSFAACGAVTIAFGLAMISGAIPTLATHWLLLGMLPSVLVAAIFSGVALDRACRDLKSEQRRID